MTFTVKIKCDNAAFHNDDGEHAEGIEIARILNNLAVKTGGAVDIRGNVYRLYDVNGNHVGEAKATTR